jgi:hypothetical protein
MTVSLGPRGHDRLAQRRSATTPPRRSVPVSEMKKDMSFLAIPAIRSCQTPSLRRRRNNRPDLAVEAHLSGKSVNET